MKTDPNQNTLSWNFRIHRTKKFYTFPEKDERGRNRDRETERERDKETDHTERIRKQNNFRLPNHNVN